MNWRKELAIVSFIYASMSINSQGLSKPPGKIKIEVQVALGWLLKRAEGRKGHHEQVDGTQPKRSIMKNESTCLEIYQITIEKVSFNGIGALSFRGIAERCSARAMIHPFAKWMFQCLRALRPPFVITQNVVFLNFVHRIKAVFLGLSVFYKKSRS